MSHPGTALDLRLVPAAALSWAGAAWAVGATYYLPVVLVLLLLAAAGLHRLRRRMRARHRGATRGLLPALVLAVLMGALAVTVGGQRSRDRAELVQPWDGQTVTATVQLQREARPHEQGAIADATLVRVKEHAGPLDVPVVVLGGTQWLDLPFGARVRTRARLAFTGRGQDRAMLVLAEEIEEVRPPSGWRARVARIRSGLAELAAPLSPAARGLVPGIALGDTRRVPAALADDLRLTSLTHLTAISGAHVALVLAVVLVGLWWAPRWVRALVGAAVLLAFIGLVRPEGSVLRAGVMGAVLLLGVALRRPRSGVPALCTAVMVLILADPWIARSYGFALSVLATAGLLLLAPWLAARVAGVLPRPVALALVVPLAAQVACLPVLVLLQPQLPAYGVLANILAAPVVPPATILGVAAALLAPHWPAAAVVLLQPAAWCAEWVATVATTLADLPAAGVAWPTAATAAAAVVAVTMMVRRRGVVAALVRRCRWAVARYRRAYHSSSLRRPYLARRAARTGRARAWGGTAAGRPDAEQTRRSGP